MARGRWARQRLGLSTDRIDAQIAALVPSALQSLAGSRRTTTGMPRYRLSPTRKFGWWFGTTGDLSWFGLL